MAGYKDEDEFLLSSTPLLKSHTSALRLFTGTVRKTLFPPRQMNTPEINIARVTSEIWCCTLALPMRERRAIGALLKWKPDVSEWLFSVVQHIDSEWTRQGILDDYLIFLYNLQQRVQKVPINWTDIADSNIELEALRGRILQLSPTPALERLTQDGSERDRTLGHVSIFGGSFTIITPCPVEEGMPTSNEGPIPPRSMNTIDEALEDAQQNETFGSGAWIMNLWKRLILRR
ncbi:hypothetical protein CPC08DRAFT_786499 [Agrocybe pediades]|nr:hypothetical protein CPC08DRAFT_786499 [Agrocybe pediades]